MSSSRASRTLTVALITGAALVAQGGLAYAWDGNIIESSAHLIVGDPGALTAGDLLLQGELADFGYTVTVVDDAASDGTSSSTALVAIAPSISSVVLGAKYKNVGTPVVAFSTTAWNDMALATSDGSFYDTTDLLVVDSTHSIAAGLPSTFKATNQLRPMRSVTETGLPAGAEPVAVRSSAQSAHVVYTVSAGAIRTDGTAAPANRAVIGLSEPALTDLTVDGMTLLDNALYWADTTSASYAVQAAVPGALIKQGQ